ncbi:MAG: pseudouridine synthase, partial [Rhodospirillaceae bacterium]
MKLILLNKPYDMLSQFTDRSPEAGGGPAKTRPTLADILPIKDVYPAGRLDRDSEGLMLLTDYGPWQARIAEPGSRKWQKTYWVQVEGTADPAIADQLRSGVTLKDGPAKAQYARLLPKDFQDP